MEQPKKSRARRIARIVLKTILWICISIIVLFLLVLTPPVQNFITGRAAKWLSGKLETRVEIKRLYITLTGKIAIDGIYVEDRAKDTLLAAGELRVNMSFTKLLFSNALSIKSVELNGATAKIKRLLPDTTFNFQFIADAFGSNSPDTVQVSDTSAGMPIDIGKVELNRIRFVYKDVVTGNDVETAIGHFDTKLEKFDLDKLHFVIPQVNISGLQARMLMSQPLPVAKKVEAVKDTINRGAPGPDLQLDIGKINIDKSAVVYNDSVNALYTQAVIGDFTLRPNKIDLDKAIFDLGDISLKKTQASVHMGKTAGTKAENTTADTKEAAADAAGTGSGIKLLFAALNLEEVRLRYDNDNETAQAKGMDYSHLDASVADLKVKDFLFTSDSIKGEITSAALKEKSGFDLRELSTSFLYTTNQAYLKNLYLKTPGTELKRDIAIRYASQQAMTNDIAHLGITADIEKSRVQVKDILTFVPSLQQQPALADANATWYLDGKINGRIGELNIDDLQLSALHATRVDINGRITGLPEADMLQADLTIRELSSTRADMASLLPAGTLPSSVQLPGRFNLTGSIKGNMDRMRADMALLTDIGNARINGTLAQITDANKAAYDITASTQNFNLAVLLKDTAYGPVSVNLVAKGKGYDMKTASAAVEGTVSEAVYNGYSYKNLDLNAAINHQQLTAKAGMTDPNIHFALDAQADLSQASPAVKMNLAVDSIKAQALHLTNDVLIYRGNISAEFPVADPDNLSGRLLMTNTLLVKGNERIQLDSVSLAAGMENEERFLQLQSDIAHLRLQGQYQLTQLPDIFIRAIDPYYAISAPGSIKKQTDPYDFTIAGTIQDRPLLRSLVPGVEKIEGVNLQSRFSSADGIQASLQGKDIIFNGNRITELSLTANTTDSALQVKAGLQQFSAGGSLAMDSTVLTASLANNEIDFDLAIKDKAAKDKYMLGGLLRQDDKGDIQLELKPQGLLLNYEKWQLPADNLIRITGDGIYASHFNLQQNDQQLLLNSLSAAPNAPMQVRFNNFQIATLTAMVMPDAAIVDGNITGELEVRDLAATPLFTGDLRISDLSYQRDTVGDLAVKIENTTPGIYTADVALSGRGNDALVKGTYNTNLSSLDMSLDLKQLPMKTAEAFAGGAIKDAKGHLNGQFKISGSLAQPKIKGDLGFNQAGFNVAMLNSYFTIDNEKIQVDEQGIRFNRFQVKDSAGNDLSINGTMATANFTNYRFDLAVRADNFKALSSTKKDNKLFWGELYFNTNLKIEGTEAAPAVDGRLTINDKTKMTVVLPQSDPGVVERDGVVVFVDMDAPLNDSLFMASYDSLNTSAITGMDVSLNVEIDKGADFTLIIDEGNGDFLNVRGEAQLNTGIDPSGKITMVGTYELEQGTYELSFNMLRKKFDIQKGSKIIWEGEPTSANVDITAKYVANTAPLDLVKGQLDENISVQERNTYLQRLPFDVMLRMEGELLKPQISFDIILPENKSYSVSNDILANVRTKLEQLRQSPGDMNKQVFSLLLLNRFVAENPFNTSSGISASSVLRQSVTKLLTEQLNRIAEGLIEGVDINLGLESSDDYTTGEKAERTDLNVGLSKRLLNDRLTVTVGSNFALEGPQNSNQQANNIAGNVVIDYALSSDGRYKLRAYRKNDYQGVIDGYVVETGVSFIITLDYNKFEQIFQGKKKREALRRQRREQREKQEQEENKQQAEKNESQPVKREGEP